MPREQKVGFTILILIVGFTGAFCFRRQPEGEVALPALQNESELNQLIAEYRLRPFLAGIDTDEQIRIQGKFEQYLASNAKTNKSTSSEPKEVPQPIQHGTRSANPTKSPSKDHSAKSPDHIANNNRSASKTQSISKTHNKSHSSEIHIVKPGETLSEIAQKYYGSASRFSDIYDANKKILSGPNQLKPNLFRWSMWSRLQAVATIGQCLQKTWSVANLRYTFYCTQV